MPVPTLLTDFSSGIACLEFRFQCLKTQIKQKIWLETPAPLGTKFRPAGKHHTVKLTTSTIVKFWWEVLTPFNPENKRSIFNSELNFLL